MKLFQYNPGVMRLPILNFRPMAVLLLAGWIISPSLATGEARKAEPPAGAGHSSASQKPEKGKAGKIQDHGKEKDSSAGKGKASKTGEEGNAGSSHEAKEGNESAKDPKAAPGNQEHPASPEDAEESEDHADSASGDSPDAAASGSARDDESDSLAGIVPSREQANRTKMNALLPPGSTHRGVYYPSFRPVRPDPDVTDPITGLTLGVDAPMDSLFRGEAVTRLDDNHVLIDKASFTQYDEAQHPDAASAPKQTLSVDLEQALYDLKNDILVSHRPVRIENEQMILTGDTMVHDRVSGLTELSGGVRVILFSDSPEVKENGGSKAKSDSVPDTSPPQPDSPAASRAQSVTPSPAAAPAAAPSSPSKSTRPAPSKKPKPGTAAASSRK